MLFPIAVGVKVDMLVGVYARNGVFVGVGGNGVIVGVGSRVGTTVSSLEQPAKAKANTIRRVMNFDFING